MECSQAPAPVDTSWTDRLLSRLSRETTSGRFIPQIDGLRSIAVLSVFLFHLDAQMKAGDARDALSHGIQSLVHRGFLGVPIFFAISAFIVGLPFARHWMNGANRVDVGHFYLRRLTRLEPPYFFNLLLLWLLGAVLGEWALTQKLPSLLASLTYQHNLIYGYFSTVNSVTWSLEIEFQFYLLAPLLTSVFALKSPVARRLLITGVALAIAILRDPASRRVELSLPGQIEYFAVGFLLLDIYLTRWKGVLPSRWSWDVVAVLAWGGFFWFSRISNVDVRQTVLFALLLVAMVGSLGGRYLAGLFGNRWVCTFGGMCYSFYLYHQWLQIAVTPALKPLLAPAGPYWKQLLLQTLVQLPFITAITAVVFITIEKPFMRRDWPQRLAAWWRTRRGSPA
jgi:peptidoglycan/LPS O-acetylase OafA/YrhL